MSQMSKFFDNTAAFYFKINIVAHTESYVSGVYDSTMPYVKEFGSPKRACSISVPTADRVICSPVGIAVVFAR